VYFEVETMNSGAGGTGSNGGEYSVSNIRILDEDSQKGLLFKALRGM
jgi:hypothetical protein